MMVWECPRIVQKEKGGRREEQRICTYLESGDMGTFIETDGCDLLDGEIRG